MNMTRDGDGLRRVTGWLLVVGAVAFAVAATVLSSTFEWPDILREPPEVVLPAFVDGGTSLVWTWFAVAWTYAILLVPVLLLPAALGRDEDPVLRAATFVGAASVLLSLIGFLRWVFVVPALADSYVSGDPATKVAVAAAWTAQHQFGGRCWGSTWASCWPSAGRSPSACWCFAPGCWPLGRLGRPDRQRALPDQPGRHPGHRRPRLPGLGPRRTARQQPVGPLGARPGRCRAASSDPPSHHHGGPGPEPQMKAVVQDRYGGPEVLELRDIDQPIPTGNEVLVQVQAAGLHRGDWHVMTGLPYMIRIAVPTLGLRKPKVPALGMDVAGRVEAVGAQVTRFRPGDEVFGWCEGAFAEYACAPEDHFAAKPAAISFEQAAVVPISGFAALQAVRDVGEVQAGQTVLVIGAAGAVGWFAVQLAKAFGAQVTGVASTSQLDLVGSIGADQVIDYTSEDVTDGTRQWDLIIDTAGRRSLSQLRRALTPKGTLVIVGGEGGGRWMGGFLRNLRAPVVSRFVGQRLRMLVSKENQDDLQTLRELIEAGKLTPLIGRTYPLGEAPEAMRALEAGNTRGKVVITV